MKIKATFPPRRDGTYGRAGEYVIGADGIVDVPDDVAQMYLNTKNFIAVEAADHGGDGKPEMIITNGEQSIDLMALDKTALLALANENMGLGLHHKTGETKLREAIMAFVSGE